MSEVCPTCRRPGYVHEEAMQRLVSQHERWAAEVAEFEKGPPIYCPECRKRASRKYDVIFWSMGEMPPTVAKVVCDRCDHRWEVPV